jgi:hypothetical protein
MMMGNQSAPVHGQVVPQLDREPHPRIVSQEKGVSVIVHATVPITTM